MAVHIMPNAKTSQIIGEHGDALKIRLQAQPIEGKANDALVRYIADKLGVARSSVTIIHGVTNKRKMLAVKGSQLSVEFVVHTLLCSE